MAACTTNTPPPPGSTAASSAAAPPKAAYFTVSVEQFSHLQTTPARATMWCTTIRTTGTVDWDNDHTTQAITQVSGPITRIVVDTGARVKAGDPLLYVASPDITECRRGLSEGEEPAADLAQRNARPQPRSAGAQGHRAARLGGGRGGLQRRGNRPAGGAAGAQDLRRRRKTIIAEAEQQSMPIRPELAMRAPIAGTVVQKLVLPGQFIQAGIDGGVRDQQHRHGLGAGTCVRQGPGGGACRRQGRDCATPRSRTRSTGSSPTSAT